MISTDIALLCKIVIVFPIVLVGFHRGLVLNHAQKVGTVVDQSFSGVIRYFLFEPSRAATRMVASAFAERIWGSAEEFNAGTSMMT